jgi:hypothetical protein
MQLKKFKIDYPNIIVLKNALFIKKTLHNSKIIHDWVNNL